MKAQKITILNNKKQKIIGYLYKNTSKTIVIMCHGLESFGEYPGLDVVFEAYYQTGSSVFIFDFTGNGESEGKREISIKQRVEDIGSVLKHMGQDYQEIILYGISFSGIVVAIAATRYKEITKLITINGLFTITLSKIYMRQAFSIYSYLLLHPNQWVELYFWKKNYKVNKISIPVLVVYGEKDDIVKPQQSIDFYNAITSRKSLIAVPNGDHPLMKNEYKNSTIAIPQWIKRCVIY